MGWWRWILCVYQLLLFNHQHVFTRIEQQLSSGVVQLFCLFG